MSGRILGPDLEIPDESAFLARERRVERVGWMVVLVLMIAAATGLLGAGPASWATASAGMVAVDYSRVVHHQTEEDLTIVFPVSGEDVAVELRGGWVEAATIRGLTPEPSEQLSVPGGVRYQLPAGPGRGRFTVAFRMDRVGLVSGEVVVDGRRVDVRQLVLP
ncbi:MAG TPA: hypothetical protein PKL68_05070 [Actinomycetota bacterium]|mgnify:CR=1 FL=1|jgi:hypothetical protein|nr:hypothetical protein [Actinomycetota bacterium]HNL51307.1 hypothetical protein [Actinomycetota bacterium]